MFLWDLIVACWLFLLPRLAFDRADGPFERQPFGRNLLVR